MVVDDPTFDADEERARQTIPGPTLRRCMDADGYSPPRDNNEDSYCAQPDLIHYVMDLEELVRWLALTFSYQDPSTGEVVVNDPIWTVWDERGTHLPAAEKLQATWTRVMHDD